MKISEEQIIQSNQLIAEFMGFEKVKIGYFGWHDETEWQKQNEKWIDDNGLESVGDFIVSLDDNQWFYWGEVAYHSDWNWLMPVVHKIKFYYPDAEVNITSDINELYKLVVNFIIKHNENRKYS